MDMTRECITLIVIKIHDSKHRPMNIIQKQYRRVADCYRVIVHPLCAGRIQNKSIGILSR